MADHLNTIVRTTPGCFRLFDVYAEDADHEEKHTFHVTVLPCHRIVDHARPVALLTKVALNGSFEVEVEFDEMITTIGLRSSSDVITLSSEQFRAACTYVNRLLAYIEIRESFEAKQLPYLLLPSLKGTTGAEAVDWNEVWTANERPTLEPLWESGLMDSVTEQSIGLLHDRTILEGTSFAERPLMAVKLRPDLRLDAERSLGTGGSVLEVTNVYGKKFRNFPLETLVVEQPLLEVIEACKAGDFLPGSKVVKPEINYARRLITIPQVCQLGPMSVSLLRGCRVIPSILTELGRQILARQIGQGVLRGCIVEEPLLLRALTLSNTRPSWNYEQLEFFGDCILKLCSTLDVFCHSSRHDEGTMTTERMRLIENEHLCRVAKRWQIAEHVFGHGPVPKHWRPFGIETDLRERTLRLSDKTLADLVEALLGAAWLCKGTSTERFERAIRCINQLGIFAKPMSLHDLHDAVSFSSLSALSVNGTMGGHPAWSDLAALQSSIAYTFRQPSLALQALTHSSIVQGDLSRSYERLEFLGDAVLDACFATWAYEQYPDLNEGDYTVLKAYATCNSSLAVVCVTNGLHRYVVHSVAEMRTRIDTFATVILATATKAAGVERYRVIQGVAVPFWCSMQNIPKQLADVLESIFGAVFVDSGFEIVKAQELFDRLFSEHLATYLNVDLLAINPSQMVGATKNPTTPAGLVRQSPINVAAAAA